MDFGDVLRDYGWLGVLVWVSIREFWPFLRDKLYPQAVEERRRKSELADLETRRLRDLEERQIRASEGLVDVTRQIQLNLVAINERQSTIVQLFMEHDRETRSILEKVRTPAPPAVAPRRKVEP